MTTADLLQAWAKAPPGSRLACGHTHPVFFSAPQESPYSSSHPVGRSATSFPRQFGAMPSNIMIGLREWSVHREAASAAQREIIDRVVLRPRLYKRFGADFCEFLCRAHAEYCPPQISAPPSCFEFIFSPRLRQLGVFRPLPAGECVYVPWVVEREAEIGERELQQPLGSADTHGEAC